MKRNFLDRTMGTEMVASLENTASIAGIRRNSKWPLLRGTLLSVLFLLCVNSLFAISWTTVGALGFSADRAYYITHAIDGSGASYVAFQDFAIGQKATVMKYSGGSWTNVGSAGFSAGEASYTSIALDGSGTPYVAYKDVANGGKATVMKYNGSSWVAVGSVGFSAGEVEFMSLKIDAGGTLYVSYEDYANHNKETVMKYNGSAWVTVGSAGFSASPAYYSSLAIDAGGTPYVAFQDSASGYKATVMKYDGSSWVAVGSPCFSAGGVYDPSIAIDAAGVPYVAYRDDANSMKATVMKFNGSSWVAVGGVGFTTGEADNTSLVIDNSGTLYLSYRDFINGSGATIMKYDGSSWTVMGSASFTGSWTWYIALALDPDGVPTIAYSDDGLGNKASVKKYTGVNTSWTIVGSEGFSAGTANYTSIVIDTAGMPLVAFRDGGNSGKATVMRFNGSTWANVGSAGFSASAAEYISLALDGNGTPYVAYRDFSVGRKVTAKKYDGSSWVTVGSAGFSANVSDFISLAINRSGTPYVVYKGDISSFFQPTVKKYDGSSWVTVGSAGFAAGAVSFTSLAMDSSGTPYVAYRDGGNAYKVTVMKFNGSNWVPVGSAGFSGANVNYTSLAFDRNNTPYVAYADSNGKASVMKYNGTNWVYVGSRGFTLGSVIYTSLAIDSNGTPYVAFQDNNISAATVMKFNGSSWVIVGSVGLSVGNTYFTSLALNRSGQPYIAYRDEAYGSKATVKKFEFSLTPIAGAATVCVGATTTLSNSTSGGTWSSSNASIAMVSASGVVTGIAAGNATITYTTTDGFVIAIATVNAAPNVNAIIGDSSVSVGETITLMNDSAGVWSVSNSNATISSSGVVTGMSVGTVVVSFTSSNLCGSAVATKVVTVNPVVPKVCVGETITLSFGPAGGTWSSSNTAKATVSVTGVVTGVTAGTSVISYSLSGTVTTTIVTVNALPATVTGTFKACPGTTTSLSDATTGGVWSSSDPAIATINSSGVISGINVGTVDVVYTLSNGCSRTVMATINPNPADITGSGSVCSGNTTTLASTTAGLSWSSSDVSKAMINSVTGIVSGLAVGTATITYKNTTTGCLTTTEVVVSAMPANISGITKACPGTTTTLTNATVGGTWSGGDPVLATIDAITGVVTGVAAGTTAVVYTIAGGCNRSAVVTINATPTIGGSLSVCAGKTTVLTCSPAASSWASSNAAVATVASGIVSGLSGGVTDITVTATTGCKAVANVTVMSLPPAISGILATCVGSTTSLSNTAPGGTWASNAPGFASINSSGEVTGLVASNVTITYTLASGCVRTGVVTVNAAPVIGGTSATMCVGASATLSVSGGGGSGTWSSGAVLQATVGSTGIVTGTSAGTAAISYTSAIGCLQTVVAVVNATPDPIGGASSLCSGNTTTLTNGVAGGNWSSSNTAYATVGSSGAVTGLTAGTATITYAIGTCRATHLVSVLPVPIPISGTASVCEGATTLLTNPVSGTWSSLDATVATVSAGGLVSGVLAGNATIVFTRANGCQISRIVTVNVCPSRPAITGVGTIELDTQIKMFPNPTNGILTVSTPEGGALSVLAVDGKEVGRYDIAKGDTNIMLPRALAAGVYMCRFSGSEGSKAMVRLIYQQ